jgi:phosphoserine phosphatase
LFIASVIAADRLRRGDISAAEDAARAAGLMVEGHAWLDEGSAFDLRLAGAAETTPFERAVPHADVVVHPERLRRRPLLVADMDSTMIDVECIDELADYAGVKAEIAAITEQAMRGELDFEAALEARVALLEGLDAAAIDRCHDERVRITPGAQALVGTMKANGAYCLLVSGGFSLFADRVAREIGFDRAVSNVLGIANGRLTGTVALPILGAEGKAEALRAACAAHGVPLEQALAVGDGANDIPMMEAAGLGIAYHAKPAAAAAADARIAHNDLSALLWAQGYPRSAWVAA